MHSQIAPCTEIHADNASAFAEIRCQSHGICKDILAVLPVIISSYNYTKLLFDCKQRYKELLIGGADSQSLQADIIKIQSISKRNKTEPQSKNLLVLDLDNTLITSPYLVPSSNIVRDKILRRVQSENIYTATACVTNIYLNILRNGVMDLIQKADSLQFDILIYSKGRPHHVIGNMLFLEIYFNQFYKICGLPFTFDGVISNYGNTAKSFSTLIDYGYELDRYSHLIVVDDLIHHWKYDDAHFELLNNQNIRIELIRAESLRCYRTRQLIQTDSTIIDCIRRVKYTDKYMLSLTASVFKSI